MTNAIPSLSPEFAAAVSGVLARDPQVLAQTMFAMQEAAVAGNARAALSLSQIYGAIPDHHEAAFQWGQVAWIEDGTHFDVHIPALMNMAHLYGVGQGAETNAKLILTLLHQALYLRVANLQPDRITQGSIPEARALLDDIRTRCEQTIDAPLRRQSRGQKADELERIGYAYISRTPGSDVPLGLSYLHQALDMRLYIMDPNEPQDREAARHVAHQIGTLPEKLRLLPVYIDCWNAAAREAKAFLTQVSANIGQLTDDLEL